MPPRKPYFSRRLVELRKAAGLSAYALAKAAGVSKQAVAKLEKGESAPSLETAARLARALGVSVADFVEPDP